MVLDQQPLLPFFSIEQEQDQCWLYWGSLTGLCLSPVGLRAVWALSWGPTTQAPVTSAHVDPKLCCGLWPTLSGLRPDHLTDSYWTALGGTELPVLSGGAWELCVCCSQLPGAANSPSKYIKTLLVARPVWMLLGFSQGSRGKPWQRDLHGKGVTDYTLKSFLGSADLFIQTFLSSK